MEKNKTVRDTICINSTNAARVMPASKINSQSLAIDDITQLIINALEDIKGEKIEVIDTTDATPLFSRMIVCSGNSNRQVKALAGNVLEKFKKHSIDILGVEGESNSEWILVDCGYIITHIMLPQVRSYYDLESLWDSTKPV